MSRRALQNQQTGQQEALPFSIPSPVGGWNARDSLADMPPTDCVDIVNFICRTQGVQTRLGSQAWSTGMVSDVETLIPYEPPATGRRLFAAAGSSIFNATSAGAAGAAVQTGLTNARFQHTNYSNSAGNFVMLVNGADSYRYWDGATWTAVANFTLQPGASAFPTTQLANITIYQNRIYFAPTAELAFYFLDAGSISGDVRRFRMGQVFRRGGSVVAVGNWSVDAGAGPDDHFVVVSSEGEVAVYSGDDPTNAALWSLIGVYYIGRPQGRRCLYKIEGELLLLTDRGLYPISRSLQSATVEKTIALSDKIDDIFRQKGSTLYGAFGWQVEMHTNESFVLVNVPDAARTQYVMDLVGGGWSRFLGWNARCFAYFNGELYYGEVGRTIKCYTGPNDLGQPIQAALITGYNYFGARGRYKHIELMRPLFNATGPFGFAVSLLGDFSRTVPAATLSASSSSAALWDVALWDAGLWSADFAITGAWRNIFNTPAYNFGQGMTVASASVTVQWLSTDFLVSAGSSGL